MSRFTTIAGLAAALVFAGAALAQDPLPALADLPAGEWATLSPPGTVCARGTPYHFFVRPGDPQRVMFYFQGGGACWNGFTCQPGGPYDDSVDSAAQEVGGYDGLFREDAPRNPVDGWSVVFLPYCTGDIHTGSSTREFTQGGQTLNISFSGYTNAQAALAWAYASYPAPEHVLVTGTSAGAYGAVFHAPHILERYPQSEAVVLGDAGVGVQAGDGGTGDVWGTAANLPQDPAFAGVTLANLTSDLYAGLSVRFPQARLAQFTTEADDVQMLFYRLLGGSAAGWTAGMQQQLEALNALPNFRSYIGPGGLHAILPRPEFYSMQADGMRFDAWFDALVNGSALPASVSPP
jgi:hypothetical protein